MAEADRESTLIYLSDGASVVSTENSIQVFVTFAVKPPIPLFEIFFEKLRSPFILWGQEYGFSYIRQIQEFKLTFLTVSGTEKIQIQNPTIQSTNWELIWVNIKEAFTNRLNSRQGSTIFCFYSFHIAALRQTIVTYGIPNPDSPFEEEEEYRERLLALIHAEDSDADTVIIGESEAESE